MAKSKNPVSLIGGLPKPTVENLPIEKLVQKDGFTSNPRENSNELRLELTTSLAFDGQKPGGQLVVSAKEDGSYLILCGNRRYCTMRALHSGDVTIMDGKTARTFKQRQFPTVECFVYKGLNLEQESQIRNDHTGVVALTEWERYVASVQLFTLGFTRDQIAGRMGFKHGTADRLKFFFLLPQVIEDWYFAKTHKQPCMALAQTDLSKLTSAWVADAKASGVITLNEETLERFGLSDRLEPTGIEVPGLFKQWGPQSQAVWDNLIARDEAEKTTGERQREYVDGRGRKHFEEQAESFKDEDWLRDAMLYAAGRKEINLHAIRQAILLFKAEHTKALNLIAVQSQRIDDLTLELEEARERLAACTCGAAHLPPTERPALEAPALKPEVIPDGWQSVD